VVSGVLSGRFGLFGGMADDARVAILLDFLSQLAAV
jgi:hypothetical protein